MKETLSSDKAEKGQKAVKDHKEAREVAQKAKVAVKVVAKPSRGKGGKAEAARIAAEEAVEAARIAAEEAVEARVAPKTKRGAKKAPVAIVEEVAPTRRNKRKVEAVVAPVKKARKGLAVNEEVVAKPPRRKRGKAAAARKAAAAATRKAKMNVALEAEMGALEAKIKVAQEAMEASAEVFAKDIGEWEELNIELWRKFKEVDDWKKVDAKVVQMEAELNARWAAEKPMAYFLRIIKEKGEERV
jgi:hypothetical protein